MALLTTASFYCLHMWQLHTCFLYNRLQFPYNKSRYGTKQHSWGIKTFVVNYKVISWRPSKISLMSVMISDSRSVKLSMEFSSKRAWRLCVLFFFSDYQSFFIYKVMHKSIALHRILKFTLKQLRHISVQSPSSGSVLFELTKVTDAKYSIKIHLSD